MEALWIWFVAANLSSGAKSMRLQLGKGSYRIRVIEQAPHKNSDFGTSVI